MQHFCSNTTYNDKHGYLDNSIFLEVYAYVLKNLTPFYSDLCEQIRIPFARNVCSSFDDSSGWTFFNLNELFDEHRNSHVTIVQADFVSIIL
jgi:hypothetical protein